MSISFDRAADYYDRTRSFPPQVMERVTRVLESELRQCKSILDVGVGTGRFAEPLQDLGLEVVGIDISSKMIEKAMGKRVRNLILANVISLPFSDLSFDASMSVHVLHLTADWRAMLREIVRVTKLALFSVLVEGPKITPKGIYRELMRKHGYTYSHPGLGEWDLKELVKPTRSTFVTSFETNLDDDLADLRQKASSYQWNAPDEIHEKAMKELEKTVTEKSYSNKVHVHRWDISEIKKHMRQQHS